MSNKTTKLSALPATTTPADDTSIILTDAAGSAQRVKISDLLRLVRDSIQIGGRNLLKETSAPIAVGNNSTVAFYECAEPLEANVPHMLSFYFAKSGEGRNYIEVYLHTKLADAIANRDVIIPMGIIKEGHNEIAVTPKKADTLFAIYSDSKVEFRLSRVKLERGNIATDWTPAPEDLIGNRGG